MRNWLFTYQKLFIIFFFFFSFVEYLRIYLENIKVRANKIKPTEWLKLILNMNRIIGYSGQPEQNWFLIKYTKKKKLENERGIIVLFLIISFLFTLNWKWHKSTVNLFAIVSVRQNPFHYLHVSSFLHWKG